MAQRRMISRNLGSSRKFHAVNARCGKLGDFAQALFPLIVVFLIGISIWGGQGNKARFAGGKGARQAMAGGWLAARALNHRPLLAWSGSQGARDRIGMPASG